MRQFLIPDSAIPVKNSNELDFSLSGKEYHYLVHVLRYRQGDSFPGIDRQGKQYRLFVREILRDAVQLSALMIDQAAEASPPVLYLFQCLPKGRKMDSIVRQATESGATGIIPLISEYSVSRPEKFNGKVERWRNIATEATQQSGRSKPPFITAPQPLSESSEELKKATTGLFFHQTALENSSLHRYLCNISYPSEIIGIAIGPEGGFSDREIRFFRGLKYRPVYLGPWILRTETAPVYALGAIQTILMEKRSWQLTKESDC